MFGIDYLISPVDFEHFREHHYGKKALLIPGAKDKFADFFGWDEINHLSRYSPLQGKSTKLVLDKQHLSLDRIEDFNHWVRKGATFAINHLQTKDPVVDKFSRILGAQLNTPVNINCYVSSPNKQGFDNHFDRHDVFIMHLEGEKQWKVFGQSEQHSYPLECMQGEKGDPPDTEPYIECTMTPGDVLYIPRGHWHYALSDTPCMHLTVGPQAKSPALFLQWLVDKLMRGNEYFRKDFPIADAGEFAGRRTDNELTEYFSNFQDTFAEMIKSDELYNQFEEYIMRMNWLSPVPSAVFPEQQILHDTIDENTEFMLPVGQKVMMKYDTGSNRAHIQLRGFMVELEDITEENLNAIFTGEPVSGRSIMLKCPDVPWENIKNALLSLTDRGVLTLVHKEK